MLCFLAWSNSFSRKESTWALLRAVCLDPWRSLGSSLPAIKRLWLREELFSEVLWTLQPSSQRPEMFNVLATAIQRKCFKDRINTLGMREHTVPLLPLFLHTWPHSPSSIGGDCVPMEQPTLPAGGASSFPFPAWTLIFLLSELEGQELLPLRRVGWAVCTFNPLEPRASELTHSKGKWRCLEPHQEESKANWRI